MKLRTDIDMRRYLLVLAFIGAGMALTAFLAWLVWIAVWGKEWAAVLQPYQLRIVAYVAFGLIGLLFVVLTGFSASIGRRSVNIEGPGGFKVNATGDDGDDT